MALRRTLARAVDRHAELLTFLACEAAAIGIPMVDILLPSDIELVPLNAIPVLIGSRLLPARAAAILAASAALGQVGKGYLDHSSPLTMLISVAAVLILSRLARTVGKHSTSPSDRDASEIRTALIDRLSPREREIVLLTLDGCTAPGIASSLFISHRTVETHLANAYRKMGVTSKVELLRRRGEVAGTPGIQSERANLSRQPSAL